MQLWFSRQCDISIREQLATQIMLAILSVGLAPGQRLPSTRELARRFRIHPNTISSGYRELQRDGWLESRKGSGVYVPASQPERRTGQIELDQLIADFFRSARKLNASLFHVRARLMQWLMMQPPDHFLLIEPDDRLAQVVAYEMRQAVSLPVSVSPKPVVDHAGAVPVFLSISKKSLRSGLKEDADPLILQLRSAQESLSEYLPVHPSVMVGVASIWPSFLTIARTMLISAGIHPDCLVLRDATQPGLRRGLDAAAAVVCDAVTASKVAAHPRILTFPLLSEKSIEDLQQYEKFLRDPLYA